jgi:transposase InsO family protein
MVERIMTDNDNAYRSHDLRAACARAGVRHLRTRPYTPRTNGKAERFLQPVMRECAYARAFRSSHERAAALPRWLHLSNVHRPHTALAGKPPISRLTMNNCSVTTAKSCSRRSTASARARSSLIRVWMIRSML